MGLDSGSGKDGTNGAGQGAAHRFGSHVAPSAPESGSGHDRRCLTCDCWFPPMVELRTDTKGKCLRIGSPHLEPAADDSCVLWELHR